MSARASIILALIATFLIGGAVGAVGGFVTAHVAARGWGGPHGGGGMRMEHGMRGGGAMRDGPGPMLRHLEERLDLTPGQSRRIESILERQRGHMDALRDSTHAEIERVLTPAQRQRFRDLERRLMRFGPPPAMREGPPEDEGPGR